MLNKYKYDKKYIMLVMYLIDFYIIKVLAWVTFA